MSRPLRDQEAVVTTADGSVAVILNATGLVVLDLLDGKHSGDDIASFIGEHVAGIDAREVRPHVEAVLAELLSAGLAEPCGDEESTA